MPNQSVVVLDFGGQYNQLIARRVRECNVYCEVKPCTTPLERAPMPYNPIGIIFTGGPQQRLRRRLAAGRPGDLHARACPILGICYGCQLMAHYLGGEVTAAQDDTAREYGKTETLFDTGLHVCSAACRRSSVTWMSHGDYMAKVPEGFTLVRALRRLPERRPSATRRAGSTACSSTPRSTTPSTARDMLRNFLYEVCGADRRLDAWATTCEKAI